MKEIIEENSIRSFLQICILISLFMFLIVLLVLAQLSEIKINTLADIGGFLGGVLGPILSSVTLLMIIIELKQSREKNSFDSLMKLTEEYAEYLNQLEAKMYFNPNIGFVTMNVQETFGREAILEIRKYGDKAHKIPSGLKLMMKIVQYTNALAIMNKQLKGNELLSMLFRSKYHEIFKMIYDMQASFQNFNYKDSGRYGNAFHSCLQEVTANCDKCSSLLFGLGSDE